MPGQTLAKSPLRGNESRKVYDYLKDLPKSIEKHPSHIGALEQSPYSKEPTEYELIVEFELRRQKEKTIILQERLRNKESFIKQMKQFQDELTIAFEKCQQELHYYKTQCENYQSRSVSFPTFNDGIAPNTNPQLNTLSNQTNDMLPPPGYEQIIREYVEEIAELKHLVIRLEEEINYHEKKNKKINNKSLSYSSKYPISIDKSTQKPKDNNSEVMNLSPINKKESSNPTRNQGKGKKERSKTLANEFIEEKRSQNFSTQKHITDFINQQSRKISSFINHFLTMCSFFDHSIENEPSIGQKLKKAWKWVKSTIVEWKYLKKEKVSGLKEFQIGELVSSLLPIDKLSIEEIEEYLSKVINKQSQQKSKKV